MYKSLSLVVLGAALWAGAQAPALAGSPLRVLVDRSLLLQLQGEPGTVVVGNPSIADVSVNGRQLFVHGRSAGETNLMVLSQSGDKLADYEIAVGQDGSNTITMFTGTSGGTSRLSYVCAPNCERAMVAGDTSTAFGNLVADNQKKVSFAQGSNGNSQEGAAKAAPAPAQ